MNFNGKLTKAKRVYRRVLQYLSRGRVQRQEANCHIYIRWWVIAVVELNTDGALFNQITDTITSESMITQVSYHGVFSGWSDLVDLRRQRDDSNVTWVCTPRERRVGMDGLIGILPTPFNLTIQPIFVTFPSIDLLDFSPHRQWRFTPFFLHISVTVDQALSEESSLSWALLSPCTLPTASILHAFFLTSSMFEPTFQWFIRIWGIPQSRWPESRESNMWAMKTQAFLSV